MFRKLSFRTRVLMAFSVFIVIVLAASVINNIARSDAIEKYRHVGNINLGNSITIGEMRAGAFDVRVIVNKLALPTNTPQELEDLYKQYAEDVQAYEAADKAYRDIPFVVGEQA